MKYTFFMVSDVPHIQQINKSILFVFLNEVF